LGEISLKKEIKQDREKDDSEEVLVQKDCQNQDSERFRFCLLKMAFSEFQTSS